MAGTKTYGAETKPHWVLDCIVTPVLALFVSPWLALGINFSFRIVSLIVSFFSFSRRITQDKDIPTDVASRMLLLLGPWFLILVLLSWSATAALAFWISPWAAIALFFCGTIVSVLIRLFKMIFGKDPEEEHDREEPSEENIDYHSIPAISEALKEIGHPMRTEDGKLLHPQPMIFYHRTNAAEAILRDGFRDNNSLAGAYYAGIEGIFLSNTPLDCNEGAEGKKLLEVRLSSSCDISNYELIEKGKPYREWCVPARIIKRWGDVRLLEGDF